MLIHLKKFLTLKCYSLPLKLARSLIVSFYIFGVSNGSSLRIVKKNIFNLFEKKVNNFFEKMLNILSLR